MSHVRNQSSKPEAQPVLGDGNCAFNAFAKLLVAHIESIEKQTNAPDIAFSNFIRAVAETAEPDAFFQQPTFREIKEYLVKLSETDDQKLQRHLAAALRLLSVNLMEEVIVQHTFLESLKASFSLYFDGAQALNQDDLFIRHSFIQDKFKALTSSRNNKDNLLGELEAWWRVEGSAGFLNAMKKDGQWAGDPELVALAGYFNVNLKVNNIHLRNVGGILPADSVTDIVIEQLIYRGIVQQNASQDRYELLPMTEGELKARLDAVPHYDEIERCIHDGGNALTQEEKTNLAVHSEELIQRGVMEKNKNYLVQNKEEILLRVGAIKDIDDDKENRRQEIADVLKQHYDQNGTEFTLSFKGRHYEPIIPLHLLPKKAAPVVPEIIRSTSKDEAINYQESCESILEKEKTDSAPKEISYSFSLLKNLQIATVSDDERLVTKKTQEELDELLARKLQEEEDQNNFRYR